MKTTLYAGICGAFILLAIGNAMLSVNTTYADETIKCGGMKWTDKGHDDNNPSKSKFFQVAYHGTLCELAKCVDHSECANHVAVDMDKFRKSPAYLGATDKQREDIEEAAQDGHGMKGFGGYEALEYVVKGDG